MAAKSDKSKKTSKAKNQSAAKVALYNLPSDSERGAALRAILSGLQIAPKVIAPERLNDPIGAIAGLTGFRPSLVPFAGEAPEEEFMLLCNLANAQVDALLSAMKEAELKIDHKAMVTKFNKQWTVADLMTEIRAEHGEAQKAQQQD